MAAAQRDQSPSGNTTMKRRGILTAAGAVVAGIVAQHAAQSVAADGATWTMPYATATAFNGALIDVTNTGIGSGVMGEGSTGVVGHGSPTGGRGVAGYGGLNGGVGVFGQGAGGNQNVNADGVQGWASGGGTGVSGSSGDGYGVAGLSKTNAGVIGFIDLGSAATDTVAVSAINNSAGVGSDALYARATNGNGLTAVAGSQRGNVGVYATATAGSGVVGGTSSATPGTAGGYFYNTTNNGSGVVGQVFAASGGAAFVGAAAAPNYAAYFTGNVVVNGQLVVSDPSYKSGALAHPDGSTRLVYCVESPESWIEDVGTGTLAGGKAAVTFDKDFTAVTHTDAYHVFLTEYGDHHGLYVETQSATGFTVRAKSDPTATGRFSWKVIVKAKSGVKSERLGKFVMPQIKLADTPPHVPDLPPVPMPPKKP